MKGAIPEAEAAPLKYFCLRWAHYIDLVLEGKILAKGFGCESKTHHQSTTASRNLKIPAPIRTQKAFGR